MSRRARLLATLSRYVEVVVARTGHGVVDGHLPNGSLVIGPSSRRTNGRSQHRSVAHFRAGGDGLGIHRWPSRRPRKPGPGPSRGPRHEVDMGRHDRRCPLRHTGVHHCRLLLEGALHGPAVRRTYDDLRVRADGGLPERDDRRGNRPSARRSPRTPCRVQGGLRRRWAGGHRLVRPRQRRQDGPLTGSDGSPGTGPLGTGSLDTASLGAMSLHRDSCHRVIVE